MGLSVKRVKLTADQAEQRRQQKLLAQRQRYHANPRPHRESQRRYYEANRHKYRLWAQKRKREKSRPLTEAERRNVSLPEYPQSLQIPFLENTGCKFMPGNGFLCCGHPKLEASSYCEFHYRVCHAGTE